MVYTDPAKAVYWTKPTDWEVDLDNPWNGLKRPNSETVDVAFADSSTHTMTVSTPPKDLRAYLTREGGEAVDH